MCLICLYFHLKNFKVGQTNLSLFCVTINRTFCKPVASATVNKNKQPAQKRTAEILEGLIKVRCFPQYDLLFITLT